MRTLKMFRSALFFSLALFCIADAIILNATDTLSIHLLAEPSIIVHRPSGGSANLDNILYAGETHQFSSAISSDILIKLARPGATPGILAGAINWNPGNLILKIGILSCRQGFARLHRPHQLSNPLVNYPLLWESTGFGITSGYRSARDEISGSITLGARESGAALLQWYHHKSAFSWLCIAGFESYSIHNQDNAVVGGAELNGEWGIFAIHPMLRYEYSPGYDHRRNPTMVPGNYVRGACEMALKLPAQFQLTDLVAGEYFRKSYSYSLAMNEIDVSWQGMGWIEPGAGFSITRRNTLLSTEPTLFLIVKAAPHRAEMRLDASVFRVADAVPLYILRGSLWLDY